jgi:hypothetical protein
MLLTLLSWIYITAICLIWGKIILSAFRKYTAPGPEPDFPIVCLTGLAGIGIFSLAESVFMPLSLATHLSVLVFAIAYLLFPTNRKQLAQQLSSLKNIRRLPLLLFSTCALLILIMGTYDIIHPDTLLYQAPAIKVMEQYKAIPGLVHLRYETAMTSMWFAVQAIFRFNFIHPNNYLFINGCVLCWFCLFICLKLSTTESKGSDTKGKINYQFTGWMLLLLFTFFSWTQIRLTAVSALRSIRLHKPGQTIMTYIHTLLFYFAVLLLL